jgi:hypothetical protein
VKQHVQAHRRYDYQLQVVCRRNNGIVSVLTVLIGGAVKHACDLMDAMSNDLLTCTAAD